MPTDAYEAVLAQLSTKELFGDIGGPETADVHSPFATSLERASPQVRTSLHFGCQHSYDALVVASDAFDSLKLLLGRSVHSPSALERMVLEAAATASWLVTPAALDERASRADDLRVQLLDDNRRLFESAGSAERGPEVPASVRDLVRRLAEEHRAAGRSSRGIRMVELVESQFGAAAIYRVLSGRAHGRPWAQEHALRPWVTAYGGDIEPLVNEITHTFRRSMEWLTWGLEDYVAHTQPAQTERVQQVRDTWGARPRPAL